MPGRPGRPGIPGTPGSPGTPGTPGRSGPGGYGGGPGGYGGQYRPGGNDMPARPGGWGRWGKGWPGDRNFGDIRRGNWVRPPNYWWGPGAAVAAGAAAAWIEADAVASSVGPAPGPDMCWFYTDTTKTAGFWDVCPQ